MVAARQKGTYMLPSMAEDVGIKAFDHLLAPSSKGVSGHGYLRLAGIEQDTDLLRSLRDVLLSGMGGQAQDLLTPFRPPDERNTYVFQVLRQVIRESREQGGKFARISDDDATLSGIFAATLGWGPAQQYIDDPCVQEIKINGCQILVQEEGRPFVEAPVAFNHVQEVLDRVVLMADVLQVQLNEKHTQATLPVAHGTRMHVTIPPRCADGHVLVVIRRGRATHWGLEDIVAKATMPTPVQEILALCCKAGANILVAGECGTGKTALTEALANTIPVGRHILTVEDHTMEIGIKPEHVWTREFVDTHIDPHAFGSVVTEALRQRPDYVIPGEVRGNEAGAILALARSGHAVMTTIHAGNCADALARFANCAALPGAHMYDGQHAHAFADAAAAFDVIIHMELWESLGRRIVSEVCFVDADAQNILQSSCTIPIVQAQVADTGEIAWAYAAVAQGQGFAWRDGQQSTPPSFQRKLLKHRLQHRVTGNAPTENALHSLLERVQLLLATGDGQKAFASLAMAWMQEQDHRLLASAQQALVLQPSKYAHARALANQEMAQLQEALRHQQWQEARVTLHRILQSLDTAAIAVPQGGWNQLSQHIRQGLAYEQNARQICREVAVALQQDRPHEAIAQIEQLQTQALAAQEVGHIALLREQALEQLHSLGAVSTEAYATAVAKRESLERSNQPVLVREVAA